MVLKPGKPVTFDIRKLTGNDTANIWGYAIIPDVEFRTKNHYLHLLIEGESYIWRWAIGNYEGYGPGRPTITFELSSDSYMRSDEEFRAELRL